MTMMSSMRLFRPNQRDLELFAEQQQGSETSYDDVGGTFGEHPEGWRTEDRDILIGHGAGAWRRAEAAFRSMAMFNLDWIELHSADDQALRPGEQVTFASWQYGVWMLNACTIVVSVDEREADLWRFGFAYGTLPGHAVAGEERFLLTWDRVSDEVRFGITKFSRLKHPLVRLVAPLAHRLQDRFTDDALQAMLAASGTRDPGN